MDFFARVTGGLEKIAWKELEEIGAQLVGFGHRRIDLCHNDPQKLLKLRGVDDIYAYVGLIKGLDHTRASLALLGQEIAGTDFRSALQSIHSVRSLSTVLTYRITASYLGRRNYSRYDIEASVAEALSARQPWHNVPNRSSDDTEPELDLRILLEDDWALVGLRLGALPLHRRPYKTASAPGSLKPPVAFCMCMLAKLAPDATLFDPTCGAGTIIIESAGLLPHGLSIGGDNAAAAVLAARENAVAAELRLLAAEDRRTAPLGAPSIGHAAIIYQGDARQPQVPPGSINALVANLPWDQQVKVAGELTETYAAILDQGSRALVPGGRVVLLSGNSDSLETALQATTGLAHEASHRISLYGAHPIILVARKAS